MTGSGAGTGSREKNGGWVRPKLRSVGFNSKPQCSGYCVGTASAETLVEDLTCPIHGIAAQERAQLIYPDRQAWLEALNAD